MSRGCMNGILRQLRLVDQPKRKLYAVFFLSVIHQWVHRMARSHATLFPTEIYD